MKLLLSALAIFAAACGPVFGAEQWKLVWADEFDQPNGSAPNPTNWVYDLGGDGWGNNELQSYTDRRVNSRIENGQLIIEALGEKFTGKDRKPRDYTSARLKTLGKQSWAYGRIEARMKLPRGQGMWPAFWMMGADIHKLGWPTAGEIDIMENIGKEPGIVHGTIHGPGYSGSGGIGGSYTLPDGEAIADDFHVFAIEWHTNKITWFLDDHAYFTVTPEKLPAGKKWVYDHPHFILLNLAVGGHWPGNPNSTTQFPQRLAVDYVRVYERK
jgi:beta-glucanase (GH16 family)